jgi:flagellar hook protein FlgE
MFQALFNSLSGLFSFSKSLDTLSNNIANMNTPGFRGSDSFFQSVGDGRGTRIAGEALRTTPGDIRQTGNLGDLAIAGEGYFVLLDEAGKQHYTRAGQFRFDENGVLSDVMSGYRVMAFDPQGGLGPIDFDQYRTIPAVATTSVSIVGNVAPGSTTTTVNNVVVFDANGASKTLSVTFTNHTQAPPPTNPPAPDPPPGTPPYAPGSFLVTIKDAQGAVVGNSEVIFASNGTPLQDHNQMVLSLDIGGTPQPITLKFGTPGTYDGMTAVAGTATGLTGRVDDGHGVVSVASLSFDQDGVMQLVYTQTEKRQGPRIALAALSDESNLKLGDGGLVDEATVGRVDIGRAGQGRFGKIAGGSLEMSNVDLTQEFAQMIVIQRGYQASSRVMTVSNEMIEQLYKSAGGG